MADLLIDLYSGSFVRARVSGHTPVVGVPFEVVPVLAAGDQVGPNGTAFASTNALYTHGGVVWFDDNGALGKVVDETGVDYTAHGLVNRMNSHEILNVVTYEVAGKPQMTVVAAYVPAPPTPEPDPEPAPTPLPIDGADIAAAIGLPGTTPELEALARTACEWLAPYLEPSKIIPPDYPGPVREACLVIALDVYQNRTAAGGESIGYDVSAGPYRMGGALWGRVAGLVGPWAAQTSEVG